MSKRRFPRDSEIAKRSHFQSDPIKGGLYRPSCGRCDVPPWEVCDCSFDWAKEGLEAPPSAVEQENDRFTLEADERLQHLLWKEAA